MANGGWAGGGGDPAARGVPDLSADPTAGAEEKAASRNTDLEPTTASRVRGAGNRSWPNGIIMHEPASDFWTDAGTCTTTPKRLKDLSFPLKHYVMVRANSGNTKAICIGNSDCKKYRPYPGRR